MGNVVTLPAERPVRSNPDARDGGAAILFFTGVRYVRDVADDRDDQDDPGALHDVLCQVVTASPAAACSLI